MFYLIYDICDYRVMGHVFYDIFVIINVSFLHLTFELGHHSQKNGLQNGSYTYDIGILLVGDMSYTSLNPTNFSFMHFYLFCSFTI